KVLRTPGEPADSFSDDPLRMLRAARFVALLDVEPDPAVVRAMSEMRERLRIVSAERIRDELTKILNTDRPSKGLDLATQTGLCDLFLPELPALQLEQDPVHRHKDVYTHTLAVVDKIVAREPPATGPDAGPPEPSRPKRLDDAEQDARARAVRRDGHAGGADRTPGRRRRPETDPSADRRARGDEASRSETGAGRRRCPRSPPGDQARARRVLEGRGVRSVGRLGQRAGHPEAVDTRWIGQFLGLA